MNTNKDFLVTLDCLGFTARIKRLSDGFSASIKELYVATGLDIEPSWHLVLLYLKNRSQATMSEMAESLRYSQPALTKMLGRMQHKGYLEAAEETNDRRNKPLRLSAKALAAFPAWERVWQAGSRTVKDLLAPYQDLLSILEHLEDDLTDSTFAERALDRLQGTASAVAANQSRPKAQRGTDKPRRSEP